MYSGVSGLRVHQTKMDVIGNNIANVNTIGFKSSSVSFSDVFYQTLQGASGANPETGSAGTNAKQIGLGANVSAISTNMSEGASQRTDNTLDMKINGDGFFVVSSAGEFLFTRAGSFDIDGAGNLATPDGLPVMGWQPNGTTGEIEKGTVSAIEILTPKNMYAEPALTTDCTVSGNIDKNDAQLLSTGVPFAIEMYDSLGYKYTMQYSIKSDATDPNQFIFAIGAITDSQGNALTSTATPASISIPFDPSTGKIAATTPSQLDITGLEDITGFSKLAATLSVDFGQLTMFAGKTAIEPGRGDRQGLGNGRAAGTMSGYSIGDDGKITARYTNGQQKLLGQIVVATFANPAGLEKQGSNLFSATVNSGEFDSIGDDPKAAGGSLTAGVIEMSNVDLSKEFTEMITTQRGFQANSRIITTSDEILQELVNLKR
jgi:flagellar hook protein FlgE